jgi:TonB family protein
MNFPSLRSVLAACATNACIATLVYAQSAGVGTQSVQPVATNLGSALQASAITRVQPTYPPLAKAARVTGSVVVEVVVDEQGNVASALALTGHPLLKDAATSAARGWRFTPTGVNGSAVRVVGTITFNFALGDKPQDTTDSADDEQEARDAVRANPYSAEAHCELGETLQEEKKYEEAIESFKQAIQLKSDYEQAYKDLASVYHQLTRYDDEIKHTSNTSQ